jgi:hypothetical protein
MGEDPWPLGLAWNLTAFADESLAEHCGWSFELTPPGLAVRYAQSLSPEPPLLLLCDPGCEAASRHADRLKEYFDRVHGFAADVTACADIDLLGARLADTPEPEVLYAYATTRLDLDRLGRVLGDAVPLVVLNLIGETPPLPPVELVRNRKLILAVHAASEAGRSREAGHQWLQTFLGEAAQASYRRTALGAFGPRVRLCSGSTGLEMPIAETRGDLFRRPLIKLLLDRVTARRDISDEAVTALREGKGVLGLVAAGTPADHPDLLPPQAWHHYTRVREAASPDAIRRLQLAVDADPDPQELLYQLAFHLGGATDTWEDALDRFLGESEAGESSILSLEWRVSEPPTGMDPAVWRERWLDAWIGLGVESLAPYRRQGFLFVHTLLVEVPDDPEAAAWCAEAVQRYRAWRPKFSGTGRRFVHHNLKPLSRVPVEDIEYLLDIHYRLADYHPKLDPYRVAQWIHEQCHDGIFNETVKLVERLHDTGFQEAYAKSEAAGPWRWASRSTGY